MLPVIIFRELFSRATYLHREQIKFYSIEILFQKRETTMYKKIIGLFCVALMVTLVGCGASHPSLTVVTGTVTYDGEPLADATIVLMPDGGDGTAKTADGRTDAQGQFKLVTTFPDGAVIDGAVEGAYVLRVVKYEEVEIPLEADGPPDEDAAPEAEMMAMMGDGDAAGPASLINAVFSSVYSADSRWDNSCSVGAIGTPTTLNITLSSDGSGKIE